MAVDKNSGEIISLDEAVHFTHSFQENNPDALKAFFVGTNNLKRIMEQDDCIGIRIYNGYDITQNKTNPVLVGVDENGEDMTNGIIVEHLAPCPPDCSKSSVLIKP